MARCFICQAETKANVGDATVHGGWVFTEARGKYNNKYGVFCPEHTLAEVAPIVVGLLERAMVPDGQRSAFAETVKHVPGSKNPPSLGAV